MPEATDGVDRLIERWRSGDALALEQLLPLIYADLRRMAAALLRSHPGHATLQTTALVNEVLLRLLGGTPAQFADGAHLLNSSARMMRQILVDRARAASAEKRGGGWVRDNFTEALDLPIPDGTDLSALDDALHELESVDRRMAQVVDLRFFVGLEVAEIAATLGITPRTAHRDWVAARSWLKQRLEA